MKSPKIVEAVTKEEYWYYSLVAGHPYAEGISDEVSTLEQLVLVTCPKKLRDPVVLESIWYRKRANQLKNESNTTGGLEKIGREPAFMTS